MLIERPAHEGYSIHEQDIILYQSSGKSIEQSVVASIVTKNGVNLYYIDDDTPKDTNQGPIYDYQIIGKIKARFDDNLWTTLCMSLWDITSDNLNTLAFFPLNK